VECATDSAADGAGSAAIIAQCSWPGCATEIGARWNARLVSGRLWSSCLQAVLHRARSTSSKALPGGDHSIDIRQVSGLWPRILRRLVSRQSVVLSATGTLARNVGQVVAPSLIEMRVEGYIQCLKGARLARRDGDRRSLSSKRRRALVRLGPPNSLSGRGSSTAPRRTLNAAGCGMIPLARTPRHRPDMRPARHASRFEHDICSILGRCRDSELPRRARSSIHRKWGTSTDSRRLFCGGQPAV